MTGACDKYLTPEVIRALARQTMGAAPHLDGIFGARESSGDGAKTGKDSISFSALEGRWASPASRFGFASKSVLVPVQNSVQSVDAADDGGLQSDAPSATHSDLPQPTPAAEMTLDPRLPSRDIRRPTLQGFARQACSARSSDESDDETGASQATLSDCTAGVANTAAFGLGLADPRRSLPSGGYPGKGEAKPRASPAAIDRKSAAATEVGGDSSAEQRSPMQATVFDSVLVARQTQDRQRQGAGRAQARTPPPPGKGLQHASATPTGSDSSSNAARRGSNTPLRAGGGTPRSVTSHDGQSACTEPTAAPTTRERRRWSMEACHRLYQKAEMQRQKEDQKRELQLKQEATAMGQPAICAKSRQLARDVEPLESRSETIQRMKEGNLESMRQQCDERERTDATYHPRITSRAQHMERSVDDRQRWEERRRQKQQLQQIQSSKDDKDFAECTFQPQLCSGTERLARRCSALNNGLTSFERLSQDAQRRSRAGAGQGAGQAQEQQLANGQNALALRGGSEGSSCSSTYFEPSAASGGHSARAAAPANGVALSFEDFMQGRSTSNATTPRVSLSSQAQGETGSSKVPSRPSGVARAVSAGAGAVTSQTKTGCRASPRNSAFEPAGGAAEVVPFEAFCERIGQPAPAHDVDDELAFAVPLDVPRQQPIKTQWRSGLPGHAPLADVWQAAAAPPMLPSASCLMERTPRTRATLGDPSKEGAVAEPASAGAASGLSAVPARRSSAAKAAATKQAAKPVQVVASKAASAKAKPPLSSRLSGGNKSARSLSAASKSAARLEPDPSQQQRGSNVIAYSREFEDVLRLTMR
eukprot:TRINITY_DN10140_c0_g2_i1.p1 TRINITY_DN10140_c0_g2~~TRINITY_DN10140_c0_g2_i1.p1  ORF type:complete len:820 (-),score=144.69 TRINITY_DN10140_c0_g2_i1:287-2746(-)